MWTRAEVKERGMLAFKANYWICVLVTFILALVTGGASGSSASSNQDEIKEAVEQFSAESMSNGLILAIVAFVLAVIGIAFLISIVWSILVKNMFVVGGTAFFLENSDAPASVKRILSGYQEGFKNKVLTMFLKDLFTGLWSLLFIIPGIVKGYEYMMIPYILSEDPDMEWKEAFAESKRLMTGEKWNAFVLDLSFIGWSILSVCTCGILHIFYVGPYIHATKAELYKTLKEIK